MSSFYYFFVQQRTDVGWAVPDGFTEIYEDGFEGLGQVAWFRLSEVAVHRLFVGEDAILPLQTDIPPGMRDTQLFKKHFDGYEGSYCGWLPYSSLLADQWPESYLYLSRPVPAHLAPLFQDGSQPFPTQALLDAGLSQEEIDKLLDTFYSDDPRSPGRGGGFVGVVDLPIFQRQRGPDEDGLILVTWKASIAEFIGEGRASAFLSLREIADEADLRVVCMWSG